MQDIIGGMPVLARLKASTQMSLGRIAYLLEHWLPPGERGSTGGTLYNYQLVEALAKRWPVSVYALHAPRDDVPTGAVLKRFSETNSFLPKSRFLHWRGDLERIVDGLSTDTLLLCTSATNAILRVTRSKGIATVALLQAYEDFGWRIPQGGMRERLTGLRKLLATGQALQSSFQNADHVIVNSNYMRDTVSRSFRLPHEPHVLLPPLTLNVQEFPSFNSEAMRSVGFVHRTGKNLDFFIKLANVMPERQFLVFGHPPEAGYQLPTNVQLRGWATDRYAMFTQAQTWVMPSRWQEPFGLVALEAISQGCRVGVSRRGGLPEAVGACGRVFEDFNVETWRQWVEQSDDVFASDRARHLAGHSLAVFQERTDAMFSPWMRL